MVRVLHPLECETDYFPWLFDNHVNLFDNIGQAINYMQSFGLRDSEIGKFRFITED